MSKSGKGYLILAYYKKNNKLSDNLRKCLADVIIEYLIEYEIHASPKLMDHISGSIVKFFKSEVKVCVLVSIKIQTYFIFKSIMNFILLPFKNFFFRNLIF